MTITSTTTEAPTPTRWLKLPVGVWIAAAVGAIAGLLLAEPGNFWGNTVPSALSFMVAALLVAVAVWAVVALLRRGTRRR